MKLFYERLFKNFNFYWLIHCRPRSFIGLFIVDQGLQDLIWLPIEQYRKDGRVVRGLQRGASSFSSSTSIAMLEITNRLVQTVQSVAEISFDLLSPDQPVPARRLRYKNSQPRDMREGASDAIQILSQVSLDLVKCVTRSCSK